MGLADLFTWRNSSAVIADEDEVPAEVDEPPERHIQFKEQPTNFTKSSVIPPLARKQSLLTQAIRNGNEAENYKSEVQLSTDLTRRRSMISNASLASTAELTSDGGLTSPARTNTPSPPPPKSVYNGFASYSSSGFPAVIPKVAADKHPELPEVINVSPKSQSVAPTVEAPRKRCITFMCDGKRETANKPTVTTTGSSANTSNIPTIVAPQPQQPRKCTIKFACPGPKPPAEKLVQPQVVTPPKTKSSELQKRPLRSPSIPRKSPRPGTLARAHRDSSGTVRRVSQSPTAVRTKPKYIVADERTLLDSEATKFHEFASEELQDDDWIREDVALKPRLTINDTLKLENQLRRLGNEAEQEALEEEDEEDNDANDSENDDEDQEDHDDDDGYEQSDEYASDGNETDNEAGFAESDESDGEGEFAFWTPGRILRGGLEPREASTYRPFAPRAPSTSSMDSLNHMQLSNDDEGERRTRRRPIKIRPGTPDLPDSTDFVCGTLDEDRPLEDAYVSCMKARTNAKHKLTPQDIDPSFPTSDPEDEEDEHDDIKASQESDDHIWIHGKFEESDEERKGRRGSKANLRYKSPAPRHHSPLPPKRLHSPPPPKRMHSPPPKQRLRSPPPRKLFANSPKRIRSPPPPRAISSPAASPTATSSHAIHFAPLGSRPGLTHTKSLPRTPNAFCRAYQISRLEAANGNDGADSNDLYSRGAIDIVKGLEQRRQRRKEAFLKKNCKKNKDKNERKPQPGKGAERMRELGLLMAGKTSLHDQEPYIISA